MRAVTLIAVFALLSCSSGEENRASSATGGTTEKNEKKKPAAPAVPPKVQRPGRSPIGVEACDSYLERYSACLRQKVPAATRAGMEQQLDATWKEWMRAVKQPDGKRQLAKACRTAYDAAAASMKQFGCKW